MTKNLYENLRIHGALETQVFDVAAGPANVGVIDTLLSAGDGQLQVGAPFMLRSTGALGAGRTLDLTAVEAAPRTLFFDVSNTDLNPNNIVLSPSVSINGAPSISVAEVSQWILYHVGGGVWYGLRQWPQNTIEGAAVKRLAFDSGVWAAGTANEITITQSAGPGPGQIGPHGLDIANTYVVQVYSLRLGVMVLQLLTTIVDPATGNITVQIADSSLAFGGTVIIVGDV